MRELVALLNEIPGVMTTGCCQGHPRRGHTFAYVGLHMDDLATLDQFVELLGKVLEGPAPLLVDLQLNWGKNFENSQEKVPAGALSFFMKLSRENRREQERAPRRSELAAFVQRLRLQARRAGLLSDPQQSDLERATLTAMRWWLDAKRSAR